MFVVFLIVKFFLWIKERMRVVVDFVNNVGIVGIFLIVLLNKIINGINV